MKGSGGVIDLTPALYSFSACLRASYIFAIALAFTLKLFSLSAENQKKLFPKKMVHIHSHIKLIFHIYIFIHLCYLKKVGAAATS
jgi:hypothetical protein